MNSNLLEIKNLRVEFCLRGRKINAVEDVNLKLTQGSTTVLAGESGSGKTITALSVTRILPSNARIVSGSVNFCGRDLLTLPETDLVKVRGREIAYIFQEPASFLNPLYTIGNQIREAIILHQGKNKKEADFKTVELLRQVKINDPQRVMLGYPHQLSGGMNQRVFLAMSLACQPKLLIADEPTTALDVTTEAEILSLLNELKNNFGFTLLFITHNLSIAKKIADRICVMYQGRVVEEATQESIFSSPQHFHTRELISAYEKIGRI